jgi:hypothetical protein
MIVSFDKNQWLFKWMEDQWHNDLLEFISAYSNSNEAMTRMYLGNFLELKGYKTKITVNEDLLISISDEEFVFLKLKYQ